LSGILPTFDALFLYYPAFIFYEIETGQKISMQRTKISRGKKIIFSTKKNRLTYFFIQDETVKFSKSFIIILYTHKKSSRIISAAFFMGVYSI
jgi:hypothetical protein